MAALARLRGLERRFSNGLHAVGPLDLDIEDGEFLSLVGPSGCGKSTALRVIAGLIAPSSGTLTWTHEPPRKGFVFQDPTLMPWATARDNVRLPLDLEGLKRAQGDALAQSALERVGLGAFGDSYPRALSGGMRMRVSIARALAAKPKLLLMDEPFAALDEITREKLNEDLLRLWHEDGLTIVFVTHSVYESTFLSTRVAVMTPRPGRIRAEFSLLSPRDRTARWRLSSEFAAQATKISSALRAEMPGDPT